MKTILAATTLALLLVLPAAHGDQALALKSGCMGCHNPTANMVGPSFQAMAARYDAADDAEVQRLAALVKRGNAPGDTLVWGATPMPPSKASPEDIATLIRWMLTAGAR